MPPLVYQHRRAAEGGHRVDDRQRVVLVRDLHQRFRIRLHAGRSLGVHEGDDLRVAVRFERVFQFLRIDGLTPLVLYDHCNAPRALDVLDHAAAEHAVAADDDLVARRHHVDEAVLHADRAGTGHREGQRVLGLVGVAQERLQLFHHLDEDRVEIADRRLAHGRKHARMDLRRARPHQRALRRVERLDAFCGGKLGHGITPMGGAGEIVGPGFHSNGFSRSSVVEHIDGMDPAASQLLDFHRPARGHVAGLHPVVDHCAVELKRTGDIRLGAENLYQPLCAVHIRILPDKIILINLDCPAGCGTDS